MSEIVFLLEEPSARAMLEGLLPRLMPGDCYPRYIVFEGKQDLERQMVKRMRGYRTPGARFLVLRDKDSQDCHAVKSALAAKCAEAGRDQAMVRVACHELESWYLADLAAVERGLAISGLAARQHEKRFANPDHYPGPSKALSRIAPSYQKVSGSRAIGPHLDPDNSRSKSFAHFVRAVKRIAI